MKFSLIILTSMLFIGCIKNGNDKYYPDEETIVQDNSQVDISSLQSGDLFTAIDTQLNFGFTTASISSISKIVTLKNLGSSGISITAGSLTVNKGFSVKLNRCTSAIAPGKTCELTIEFSSRGLYNGIVSDNLIVQSGSNQMSIPLRAEVREKINPNTLEPSLSFELGDFSTGTGNTRELIVSNAGPGDANNFEITLPEGYSIWLNRCPATIKARQSCVITILNKKSRSGSSMGGSIEIAANSFRGILMIPPIDIVSRQATNFKTHKVRFNLTPDSITETFTVAYVYDYSYAVRPSFMKTMTSDVGFVEFDVPHGVRIITAAYWGFDMLNGDGDYSGDYFGDYLLNGQSFWQQNRSIVVDQDIVFEARQYCYTGSLPSVDNARCVRPAFQNFTLNSADALLMMGYGIDFRYNISQSPLANVQAYNIDIIIYHVFFQQIQMEVKPLFLDTDRSEFLWFMDFYQPEDLRIKLKVNYFNYITNQVEQQEFSDIELHQ